MKSAIALVTCILITAQTFAAPPSAQWDFKDSADGWKNNAQAKLEVLGGQLVITPTNRGPYIHSTTNIAPGNYRVNVELSAGRLTNLYWATSKNPNFNRDMRSSFAKKKRKGTGQRYAATIAANNPITKLRIDADRNSKKVVIDRITVTPYTPVKVTATPPDQISIAEGFKVELLHSVPRDTQDSWVNITVDPKGRLITSGQKFGLFRITPPKPGEPASKTKVETLHAVAKVGDKEFEIGTAQGLVWAFDSLYVVAPHSPVPGLYRLRDTTGDDQFDKVELLRQFEGGGEHGPHAVITGPKGKYLYVIAGNHQALPDPEKSVVPRLWGEDHLLGRHWDARGHARGKLAPGGWVCRVTPNGKEWTLFSIGYRNQYDIAFNRAGDLFTYDADMEWDIGTPWYRPTRVCHVTSGSEFGWRSGTGKWPNYYPDSLPAVIDIGPGSPTGIVFGYGAKFPAKYQNALFISDWSYGKVYAVHMTPKGASYTATKEQFMAASPLPVTDLIVNPKDGAMYFAIGGRNAQSGLYRVTYTGNESTQVVEPGQRTGTGPHALRRKLESLHGKTGAKVAAEASKHLSHPDRFVRFAARVAMEHQPQKLMMAAPANEDTVAQIEMTIALARQAGIEDAANKLAATLIGIDYSKLDQIQKLAMLRAYALTFTRHGPPNEQTAKAVIAKLDNHYPATTEELNRELSQLLIYLKAPAISAKTIKLLSSAPTQEEQIHYALMLRNHTDWTNEDHRQYLSWFNSATAYRGGMSFAGFVRNIKADAVKHLSTDQQKLFADVLKEKPVELPPIPKAKGPGKTWKIADLLADAQNMTGRNFENGRRMFGAAQCFQCHRFNGKGGIIGPDLTGVGGRFGARDLLESIIEPSKTISDQYGSTMFTLIDGTTITGRVVNLGNQSLRVSQNMFDPSDITNVDQTEIDSMKPSPLSMMPTGLINQLNKNEVLDLMAYLMSRGDRNDKRFK